MRPQSRLALLTLALALLASPLVGQEPPAQGGGSPAGIPQSPAPGKPNLAPYLQAPFSNPILEFYRRAREQRQSPPQQRQLPPPLPDFDAVPVPGETRRVAGLASD